MSDAERKVDKKYFPIGSKIVFKETVLEVVLQESNKPFCKGCYFSNHQMYKRDEREYSCYRHGLACTANNREDGKHVIFKELN